MPTVALLNQEGKELKQITLDDSIFGVESNQQVIYDVVNAQRAAMRQGTHDTKNRREVRGGGRKPWKQKGTGRARQGSIRATQWRGGGIVFGPTPRSYEVKVNRKVRQLALKVALSSKVASNDIIVLDSLVLNEVKTKGFINVMSALNVKDAKTLFVLPEVAENVALSSRNVPNSFVNIANHVSVLDILTYKKLVLTEAAVKYFEEVLK